MKMTIEQTVAAVKNAPGSMYTREDVISLLSKLDVATTSESVGLSAAQMKGLIEAIVEKVEENCEDLSSDYVDQSSATFSLNYNEIELDSVDLDTRAIAKDVVDGLEDRITEFFEDFVEEAEEVEEEENA